jgi:hypothetical protein
VSCAPQSAHFARLGSRRGRTRLCGLRGEHPSSMAIMVHSLYVHTVLTVNTTLTGRWRIRYASWVKRPTNTAKRPGVRTYSIGTEAETQLNAIARSRTVAAGGSTVTKSEVLRELIARAYAQLRRH